MQGFVTSIGTVTNGYRSDGMRAWKQVGSGSKTYFLYDGGNPIIEMNSSGTTTAINTFGPDGLVARQSGGSWTYYTFDVQGNVAVRQSSDGTIASRSTFDAYGQETSTGSPSDPYAYNGQWGYTLDRETGLYLCQHRYYDPANGRWLNRDPIGYAGGANLYGYCGGGPVSWMDPEGAKKRHVVAGDTAGEALFWWVRHPGSENNVNRNRMIDIMSNATEVVVWGHGSRGKLYFNNGRENHLTPNDLDTIIANRRRKKQGKMAHLLIEQCYVLADPYYLNKLLEIAETVEGYSGLTFDKRTMSIGDKKKFTEPVDPVTHDGVDRDSNYKGKTLKNPPSKKSERVFP